MVTARHRRVGPLLVAAVLVLAGIFGPTSGLTRAALRRDAVAVRPTATSLSPVPGRSGGPAVTGGPRTARPTVALWVPAGPPARSVSLAAVVALAFFLATHGAVRRRVVWAWQLSRGPPAPSPAR